MVKYLVIADDLTGANATGVLLGKLKTISLMELEIGKGLDRRDFDVIVYSTDSRGIEYKEAYNRVFNAVKKLKNDKIGVYNKRIDSTLRGNLGAEIDAILDAIGDKYIAIIVPVFPDAKRLAIGGYLLVNGQPLINSDAARDSKNPINTSVVKELIEEQTKYKVDNINLDIVSCGKEKIKERIIELQEQGIRLFIVDGISNNDLEVISEALIESNLKFVTVDPGPFTACVVKQFEMKKRKKANKNKVLMIIGSITNTTKIQLDRTINDLDILKVDVDVNKLLINSSERYKEINRVASEILKHEKEFSILCIAVNSINPQYRVDLKVIANKNKTSKENLSLLINNSIGEITYKVLKDVSNIEGIFSSGGDITVSVCQKLKSQGIELVDEVIPLAAFGEIIGGYFPNLKIVTKGGMVGDIDGMKKCVEYLLDKMN